MLKKIKDFFKELICSPSGTATLVLLVMILLSASNFINIGLLFSNNTWTIPLLLISFFVPLLLFRATHGSKNFKLVGNLNLPKKYHVPTILFSFLLLIYFLFLEVVMTKSKKLTLVVAIVVILALLVVASITKGVDKTVRNVGILAREGMRQTDRTILEIMLQND